MATALAGFRLKARRVGAGMSGLSAVLFGHAAQITNAGGGSPADITTFTITSTAGGSSLPFVVGHVFAKGDVPSGTPIGADSGVQVTVKRRWNDGSVKHAIISGRKTLTANVASTITLQTNGTVAGGASLTSADIQTAAPSASIQCGAIGTVNLSSLLASPFRTWVSGPEMVECHYRSAVGADVSLNAWFHVRLFAGGRVWVRAFVENGYIGQSPSTNTYTATVVIGGVTVYNASVSHYAFTRWCVEGWIGGDPAITPAHNVTYLIGTKLVPNYWKRTPSASKLNGLTQTYAPMQLTPWPSSMGAAGFGDYIGVLPNVDALYVTSADSRAYKAAMAAGSAFGTYSIYRRDSTTQLPGKPSDHASTTWAGSGNGSFSWSNTVATWELNHLVNGGFLPYLISGDFWHYEALAFNAAACYFSISISNGTGTSKILIAETRGAGWMENTLGHYCAIAPANDVSGDDATLISDYQSLLTNNAAHWASESAVPGISQLGGLYEYNVGLYGYTGSVSQWQANFWLCANAQVGRMEPIASMTNWNTFRDWMYKWVVGQFGPTGSANWHYSRGGSRNDIKIATANDWSPDGAWYSGWGDAWTGTFGSANAETTNTLESSAGQSTDVARAATNHRWGVALAALSGAVEDGATGASTAWSRLTGATNWSSFGTGSATPDNFDDTPVWGIVPRGWDDTMPSWYPSVGAVAEISSGTTIGSSVRAEGGNSYPGTDPDDIVEPWSGGAIVYISSQPYLVVYGGGHGDSYYNGIHKFGPLYGPGSNSPTWSVFLAASAVGQNTNNATYLDGRQCSPHSYNMLVGVADKMYCLATNDNDSTSSGDAFSFTPSGQSVLANNPTTGQYGASAHYAGKLYYIGANTSFDRLRIFNIAAGTWSSESNADIAFGNYVRMAVDTTRGKLLVLGSNAHAPTGNGAYWDLTTLTRQVQIAGPSNDTASLEYDADRDVFVSYQSGSLTVYETSAADLAAGSGASWVTRTFTGSAPASSPTQGTFGRFRFVPELKGYIVVPNLETSVYFFRST